jgi:hypothetical protein
MSASLIIHLTVQHKVTTRLHVDEVFARPPETVLKNQAVGMAPDLPGTWTVLSFA